MKKDQYEEDEMYKHMYKFWYKIVEIYDMDSYNHESPLCRFIMSFNFKKK